MRKLFRIGINDYPEPTAILKWLRRTTHPDWGANSFEARGFSVRQLLNSAATGNAMRKVKSPAMIVSPVAPLLSSIPVTGRMSRTITGTPMSRTVRMNASAVHMILLENGPTRDDELDEIFSRRTDAVRVVLVADLVTRDCG